jgi:hypothetical protein
LKLGIGDFYCQGFGNPVIIHAQAFFWGTIEKKAIEVIKDLKENVFEEYKSIKDFPFESLRLSYSDFVFEPDKFYFFYKYKEYLEPFRISLLKWTQRYNLLDEWLLEKAFRTLFYWSNADFFEHNIANVASCTIGWFDESQFPKFEFRQWNPLMETWSYYQQKLEKAAGSYKKEIEKIMSTSYCGIYTKTPVIKKSEQFEWLVRFQVKNWSYSKIARYYFQINPTDESYKANIESKKSVLSRQLHALANLIGLTLRTSIEDN